MILRVSVAEIRDGFEDEFMLSLLALVADFPDRYEGLVRHEMMTDRDDPRRVQYMSLWEGEQALRAYAGERWRTDPVTFPGEERLLAGPLRLRHFMLAPST